MHRKSVGVVMGLQKGILPIDLGQGVDTKTDPKMVIKGNLLLLENGIFTNPKRISKRNGYTELPTTIVGGGNLIGPKMAKVFNAELTVVDGVNLYGFSPSLQAWINKGDYQSIAVNEFNIFKELNVSDWDSATLGNYSVYCWCTSPINGIITTYATVVDLSDNSIISTNIIASSMSSPGTLITSNPKCLNLGNSKLGIIYLNSAKTSFVCRTIDPTSAGSFGSGFSAEITLSGAAPSTSNPNVFSSASHTPTGGFFIYNIDGTGYELQTLDTSGNPVNTATVTSTVTPTALTATVNLTDGRIWVYWARLAGSARVIEITIYTSTLSVSLSINQIVVSSSAGTLTNISTVPNTTILQTVYFNDRNTDSTSGALIDETKTFTFDDTRHVSFISSFMISIFPISNYINISGRNYMVFQYAGMTQGIGGVALKSGQVQPTYFLMDLTQGIEVVRFASGLASNQVLVSGSPQPFCYDSIKNLSFVTNTIAHWSAGIIYSNFIEDSFETDQLNGLTAVEFDFNNQDANIAKNTSELMVLNGGVVSAYDGSSCTELGFPLFPEVYAYSTASSGGLLPAGTYSIVAVYQWMDGQGNQHQSSTSLPIAVTFMSGTTNLINIVVTTLNLTQKQNVTLAVFITEHDGTTYFMDTDPVDVTQNVSGTYVTPYVLGLTAENVLVTHLQLYTTGNVLDNSPPPPSMVMTPHNNRLWMVDSENTNNVWYTKSFEPGVGLSPSAFLTEQVDPTGGGIAGLLEMDDKLVLFKGSNLFWQAGDGANDTGTGSTLSTPQILPTDVGLLTQKSLILMPNGIYFQSPKGIYHVDRSLNVSYIGMAVEAYNSQIITAATLLGTKSQIRFLTASGSTLVHDYIFNQWSVFTNHLGYAAELYNGIYLYLRTDGNIYQESTSSFLDNATSYTLRAQTSWLTVGSVQNFQRIWRTILLGDLINNGSALHGVQISAAHDFINTFLAPVPFYPGKTNAAYNGPFQYRQSMIRQKCDAISLLIEEIVTGASGEYIDFTNVSFEAGMKQGVNKLPAAQST